MNCEQLLFALLTHIQHSEYAVRVFNIFDGSPVLQALAIKTSSGAETAMIQRKDEEPRIVSRYATSQLHELLFEYLSEVAMVSPESDCSFLNVETLWKGSPLQLVRTFADPGMEVATPQDVARVLQDLGMIGLGPFFGSNNLTHETKKVYINRQGFLLNMEVPSSMVSFASLRDARRQLAQNIDEFKPDSILFKLTLTAEQFAKIFSRPANFGGRRKKSKSRNSSRRRRAW